MSDNSVWASPWKDEDVGLFTYQMKRRYGGNTIVVNKPLRLGILLFATDGTESNGKQPASINVVGLAESATNAAGAVDDVTTHWPDAVTTRSQNPTLNLGGVIPANQGLLIGGVACAVHLGLLEIRGFDADPSSPAGSWIATTAMNDAINGVTAALESSELFLYDNTIPRGEAVGHEFMSWASTRMGLWGPSTTQTTEEGVTVADELLYSGQMPGKNRTWKRFPKPAYFDGGGGEPARPQSTLKVGLSIPRKNPWPIVSGGAIRMDFFFDALWAYNPTGDVSNCDPGDQGGGVGPGYTDPAKYAEMIKGKERW